MFHHRNNGDKLIHRDGKFYWVKRTTDKGTKYLVCKESRGISRYPATANQTAAGLFVVTKPHKCIQNDDKQLIYEFEELLHAEVRSQSSGKLRLIYDDVASRNAEASVICPFVSIEHKMKQRLRDSRPRQPHSIADMAQSVNAVRWREKYTHYDGGVMSIQTVRSADNSKSVIFVDINLLTSLQPRELLIDATFKVCPRRLKILQFLTIMGKIDDTYEPMAWAFMERKTVGAYLAVFEHLKLIIGDNWMPQSATVDFERALRSAIRIIFRGCVIKPCYFHYLQNLKDWLRGFLFYRQIMGLALLKATAINEAFQNLINETERDILLYFDGFLRYYRRWWINTVKPANFSVFGFHERTNNAIESYHRVLTVRIGIHLNIWTFIEQLLKLQTITRKEISSIQRGRSVRRPQGHQYIARDVLIKTVWQMYDRNTLDNANFLTATSHILGGFGNEFMISEPGHMAMFQNDLAYEEIVNIFEIPQLQVLEEVISVFGDNVSVLRCLDIYRCTLCDAKKVANIVSTPCWHWFSCDNCLNRIVHLMAQHDNLDIICHKCNQIVTAFQRIDNNTVD